MKTTLNEATKQCPHCNEVRLHSEFGTRKVGNKLYLNGYCQYCRTAKVRRGQEKAKHIRAFAEVILHGDAEHCAWLLQAAEDYINSKPIQKP